MAARPLAGKFSVDSESPTPSTEVARRFSDAQYDDDQSRQSVSVDGDGSSVRLTLGGEVHDLDRERARELRDALSGALSERREFVHTACEHREDGAYVVERRGASSSGHRKVFDSLDAVHEAFASLPEEFVAEDVSAAGVSGGRRHMLVWHFAECSEFDCELVSRQPLTARKAAAGTDAERGREVAGD